MNSRDPTVHNGHGKASGGREGGREGRELNDTINNEKIAGAGNRSLS